MMAASAAGNTEQSTAIDAVPDGLNQLPVGGQSTSFYSAILSTGSSESFTGN
jgi:hypothetical protein